jgi:ferrous-iron efflux pump FieF
MNKAGKLNRSAAFASITVALLLAGLKSWAVLATHSTAMLGSLADTVLDLVASMATLAGVWVAAQPADDNHRFGHGKAEALAALFQVVLISFSAITLGLRAIAQWFAGARPAAAEGGIAVSVVAILATMLLLVWQRRVIAQTGSIAIATDHLHYKSDLVLNLAVIAALALDQYAGVPGADAVFGLAIALWLGWSAWLASQTAVEQLMDHEWPDERKVRFLEVVARHPELKGLHDLRTRSSGNRDFVQFHMSVNPDMTVRAVHDVMDEIEAKLLMEFPGMEILIHPDPEGLVNETGSAAVDLLARG